MKNRIRVLRAEKDWSQAELAGRVRVSRNSINAVENGRFDPSLPLAFRIADAFGNQFVPGFRPAVIDALSNHAGSRRLQALNQTFKPAASSDDAFVLKEDIVLVSDVFVPTIVPGANVHSNVLSIKNCRLKGQTREFDWPARLLIYNDAHVKSSLRIMIDHGF